MKASRKQSLCPKIIFTPSIPGSGKSMLGAVLTGFDRVEIQRLIPAFEYTCNLHYLGKIEEDAAIALIKMYTDFFCYNTLVSRDVSFRPQDWTSAIKDPNRSKYIERLFLPDGDEVFERIEKERPLIQNTSHMMLSISEPVRKALEDRWFFVEIFRHPIFLVHHWFCYVDRFGKDAREFTICLDYNGHDLPWFTLGWEEQFLKASTMDKAILSVDFLFKRHVNAYEKIKSETPNQIMCFAFEKFVVNPEPIIDELAKLLGTKRSDKMLTILQQQKVPRDVPTDGPLDISWVTRFEQKEIEKGSSEKSEYQKYWSLAKKHASNSCIEILEQLCGVYEDKFIHS